MRLSVKQCFILMLIPTCVAISTEKNLIWSLKPVSPNDHDLALVSGDPAAISGASAQVERIDLEGENAIYSVCSNYHAGVVYVADFKDRRYHQWDIGDNSYRTIHIGVGDSLQMTVDWSNENLYWVDGFFGWIAMKSLDRSDQFDYKVLVERDVDFPLAIAVDPKRGFLFWTEVGGTSLIKRASLGGASPQVIVLDGLYEPRALTIDIATGRIYWVDRVKETVEYCNSDGQDRNVLRKMNSVEFFGIAHYKNFLFVTDQTYDEVLMLNSTSGAIVKRIDSDDGSPRSIAVYAEENQPALKS
ncbi:low-density lipoprotein receptor-related protein 6-like [Liolophura sinensis]|uniref:low-density lipoprotein receptor-related protein 6-like n=1 Tax=Liolophura sinensis TaxID=3198878 RepID=UPI0031591220